jgi:hypothetical protein
MRLIKVSLACIIALALFGVCVAFIVGVARLPFLRQDPGSLLSFFVVGASVLLCASFFAFIEHSSKHVPFLRKFMSWLDGDDQ